MNQLHSEKQCKYFAEAIRLHYKEGYGSDRIEKVLPVGKKLAPNSREPARKRQ